MRPSPKPAPPPTASASSPADAPSTIPSSPSSTLPLNRPPNSPRWSARAATTPCSARAISTSTASSSSAHFRWSSPQVSSASSLPQASMRTTPPPTSSAPFPPPAASAASTTSKTAAHPTQKRVPRSGSPMSTRSFKFCAHDRRRREAGSSSTPAVRLLPCTAQADLEDDDRVFPAHRPRTSRESTPTQAPRQSCEPAVTRDIVSRIYGRQPSRPRRTFETADERKLWPVRYHTHVSTWPTTQSLFETGEALEAVRRLPGCRQPL